MNLMIKLFVLFKNKYNKICPIKKRIFKGTSPYYLYQSLTVCELANHLQAIDDEANELYDQLVEQYKEKWHVTEELIIALSIKICKCYI